MVGSPVHPQDVRLSEVARETVASLAPDELDMLVEVTAAWQRGELDGADDRAPATQAGTIGSGLDPQLISLIIYPILTGAVAQVLGTATTRRLWRRRDRQPAADQVLPRRVFEQAEVVRDECVRRALAAGLSQQRACLLGDAVYGALLRQAGTRPR